MRHISGRRRYLNEMAEMENLSLIDDKKWVELVGSDTPQRVKVNPVVRVATNLTLATAIGLSVTFLAHLIVPM
jgi:hypothetical protein